MNRVLITGATGRLGRRLLPMLLEHDWRIRVLAHRAPVSRELESELEIAGGGVDGENLGEAVRDVNVVCHLAALMPPAADDEIFRVNVGGTYRLLQAVAACPVKPRFVFASTDATYCTGWSLTPYHSPIDETTPLRPALFYGVSKVVGEQMCVHFQDIYRIPIVRLRFDWIMEPHELLNLFTASPYKDMLVDEDKGKWDEERAVKIPLEESGAPFVEQVCDVRDTAQGALLGIEHEDAAGHVFNIAGPAPFTYKQIGSQLAERIGVSAVEGRCRGLHSYEISNQKARGILGYRPQYGVLESLEDALSGRAACAYK
jgi:nucleoside-diphosphate-sugar epimerase